MRKMLQLLMVICSLLGITDASYLTRNMMLGVVPKCNALFKCETVLTSKWSSIGPVPLSLIGLFFYLILFLVSVLIFLEFENFILKSHRILLTKIQHIMVLAGIAFSFYLVFIMGIVLKAWCIYCLFSAANCVVIFILDFTQRIFYSKKETYEN